MLLSERVGADEALSLGLLNRLVPDDEVAATARGIAGQLAGSSAQAIGAMKANLREAGTWIWPPRWTPNWSATERAPTATNTRPLSGHSPPAALSTGQR